MIRSPQKHPAPALPEVVLSDGVPIGSVVEREGRFDALTVGGRYIATFPNARNARRTLHWLHAMGAEERQ